MFLNELTKQESIAFINLVKHLAVVDKVFSDKENDLLEEYIGELSLKSEAVKELNYESAVKELEESTARSKNIIYFELVGLALVDGSYDTDEISFLNKLALAFNISSEKQHGFINYFEEVSNLYEITFIDYESKLEVLKERALALLD